MKSFIGKINELRFAIDLLSFSSRLHDKRHSSLVITCVTHVTAHITKARGNAEAPLERYKEFHITVIHFWCFNSVFQDSMMSKMFLRTT